MTANDSSEALSTLRGQCNNIDVVITEYHMPNLNGVQLQRRINEEFGNMPVIDPPHSLTSPVTGSFSITDRHPANLTGASCVCGSPGASTRSGFVGESKEL
ncbi:hypothetical protein DY000_02061389 [Brassica cretica]|uniref:Response regulatory domain-containing protein n=1 Tax=Brassica cretica TaxID=69181 RepID=A0ABQ7AXD1_BRACR|nr:hypothetical protein DY000_02061389 [Brassica cretica]